MLVNVGFIYCSRLLCNAVDCTKLILLIRGSSVRHRPGSPIISIGYEIRDPETLGLLYRAFDAAWKAVAPQTPAADHERVRDAIAQAVVALAQSGQLAPNVLEVYAKEQALAAAGLSAGGPSYSLPLLH